MSDLQHVRAHRQRRALEILAGEADGLTGVDLWERVSSEIPLLPEELGVVKDGKTPRARVTWMFQTSRQTQAGWLAKASLWRVTAAGHQALADYTDPDAFWAAALATEQQWRSLLEPGPQPDVSMDVLASLIIPTKGDHAARNAARAIIERGLGKGDSLFVPDSGAWSAPTAEDLYQRYNLAADPSDDKFLDKLAKQLDGAPDPTIVLAAEIVALLSLPLTNVSGETKRHRMRTILGWMAEPATTPLEVSAGFMHGSWHGGTGSNTQLWKAMRDIVEFTRQWWELDDAERGDLLEDPWAWSEYLEAAAGLTMPSTRNTLKYFAFPAYFPPIVSDQDRRAIREAFADRLPAEAGGLDRDLFAITTALQVEASSAVDFYRAPWLAQWDEEAARKARRAWLIRGSNVSGSNLVPTWLTDGFISLHAKSLPVLPLPASKEEIDAAVQDGYSGRSQSYRRGKTEDYDRFIRRMQPGDEIVTTSEGLLYVGSIDGAPYWAEDSVGPARLRRPVRWRNPTAGLPFADLPEPLPNRLGAGGDLTDLTADLDLIAGLPGEVPSPRPGGEGGGEPSPVHPPPTPRRVQLPLVDGPLAERLHLPVPWLNRLVTLLSRRKQVILYGPPGTGKTYIAQHLAEHLTEIGDVALVQFHPSYAYEDFVMGYRPMKTSSGVVFDLKQGPLMRIAENARDNRSVPHVLIIDEINRANLAKVFGELYFLLEYREKSIELLYSEEGTEEFDLPENLFIIGTMNTADRSIALVDAAMRRRFAFVELHPSAAPVNAVLRSWLAAKELPNEAADLLDALNARITDRDFRIGPSYFMKDWIYSDPDGLETVWESDLLPLLEEHHAGDGTDVAARYGLPVIRARAAKADA